MQGLIHTPCRISITIRPSQSLDTPRPVERPHDCSRVRREDYSSASALPVPEHSTKFPHAGTAAVDYTIFRTSSLSVLGTFTIDPSLAAPVGESNVNMTALTFTEEVPPFGDLTITLGDIDVGDVSSFRAIFLDGQIASISAIGSGDLPGGIRFFLDSPPTSRRIHP